MIVLVLIRRCVYFVFRFGRVAGWTGIGVAVDFSPTKNPLQDFVILFRRLNLFFSVNANQTLIPIEDRVDRSGIALETRLNKAHNERFAHGDNLFFAVLGDRDRSQ
jgi:hypothetical protein